VIGALAEGSSIPSIARIIGVHRDTIMRLGVRAGKGCEMLMDSKMQDLGCRYLQFDEVWGFIGKKERHVRMDDDPTYGDGKTVWAVMVEVFELHGHPKATRAYAWAHETDNPEMPIRHVTVLKIPPVVSPITAVKGSNRTGGQTWRTRKLGKSEGRSCRKAKPKGESCLYVSRQTN